MPNTSILAAALIFIYFSGTLSAQQSASNGDLGIYQVRSNFYMLVGAGANIGVQIGSDGVVLVDTGSPGTSSKVLEAIKKLTALPIRYIVNTSADSDHVGGNEALAKAGVAIGAAGAPPVPGNAAGVTIQAAIEVLNRMSAPSDKVSPFPVAAWPTETLVKSDRIKSMALNDDGIQIIRAPGAHSDGDLMVLFRRADVIVAGDILDTTRFPVIDVEKGGSVQGEIAALEHLIELTIPPTPLVWKQGGTFVLPANGYVCEQSDVVEYRDMMVVIRDTIRDLIEQGKTLDQIRQANPTLPYRARYGSDSGPWTTDMFVESVYKGLISENKQGGKQ
jgi:glyoxylase-like metal-dependent hydrolase (beta-lactamase superfamily II)